MRQSFESQNLSPLVDPLADYVTATPDRKQAIREVIALLLQQIADRDCDARRVLNN